MPIDLPAAVTAYFTQENNGDTEALADCFSPDAVVLDEGRTIQGLDAIKAWKTASRVKYRHTIQVLGADSGASGLEVRGLVTGDFLGSPLELRFLFGLEGGKIAALEIRP
jgi:hypothetical protein